MRAARCTPTPTYAASSSGSVTCMPMRTFTWARRARSGRRVPLSRGGGGRRVLHAPEDGEECVTLCIHDAPAVRLECVLEDASVLPKRGGVSSPSRRSNSVEPSMSVKRNATVPRGELGYGRHDRRGRSGTDRRRYLVLAHRRLPSANAVRTSVPVHGSLSIKCRRATLAMIVSPKPPGALRRLGKG